MSKKTATVVKQRYFIHPLIVALIFMQCAITLFVVIHQQTQIEHAALMEKIQILQRVPSQVFCPVQEAAKQVQK